MNESERVLWLETFRAAFLQRSDAREAAHSANEAVAQFRKAIYPA